MQIKFNRPFLIVLLSLGTVLSSLVFVSCEDYMYENEEPDFLGGSIYEYLEKDGNFKYFLRLIDDLEYTEVLSKTGSKTLFPARDDAFERFFQSNPYGASSFDDLSIAQKRTIMNGSMVNMAYLSYMLSNTSTGDGLGEGLALRHNTEHTFLDSISYIQDQVLFKNPYWDRFSEKGVYLVDDETPVSIAHFTAKYMNVQGMTDDDFYKIFGEPFSATNIYINQIKVIEQDIICKNGYVHVLEDVMLPPQNMSQIIRDNGQTGLFNELMNKFSAPYYSSEITNRVNEFYDGSLAGRPVLPGADSVFIKRYFTESLQADPQGNTLSNYGYLHYDPANNSYGYQTDMGAMFVPTDNALNEYLNGDRGRFLKESYDTWDDVPTSILSLFLKNHQKKSFIGSLPHLWPTMQDESSGEMYVQESDIVKTYIGSNGAVYVTNRVFPPIDYQCVYGPVLISEDTKIMNWGIQDAELRFSLYLRSMENMYNLIVPIDEALKNYRDPIAWAKGGIDREIWEFEYDAQLNRVIANVFTTDDEGNKLAPKDPVTTQSIIKNRLNDIIDMHIVVGEKEGDAMWGYINEGNQTYYRTKSGTMLRVNGSGDNITITGGGDLEQESEPAKIVTNPVSGKKSIYDSDNGRTYFVDKVVQDPVKSVYDILGEKDEYTYFFNLLRGDERVYEFFSNNNDEDVVSIFDLKVLSGTKGLGYVVSSFNNFRYTVFVPTEDALRRAFQEDPNLLTWEEIHEIDGGTEEGYELKKEKAMYLINFLKYHFMDNAIFITGDSFSNMNYETAARNEVNKFHKLTLSSNGDNIHITTEAGNQANVIKTGNLYNIMARDYIIDSAETMIISSSRSVIHLIDNVLRYE